MSHQVLLDLPKNAREAVRVTISEFQGKHYVHLRNWFEPREGGEKLPGKEGVTFTAEHISLAAAALRGAR